MLSRPIRIILGLSVAGLALIASSRVEAARDLAVAPDSGLEIIVMEVQGCRYCPLFRQDVLPIFAASPRARDVPIRFMDLNAEGADRLKLKSPIATVPTAVVMRDHAEVGRIEGYVGAADFNRLIGSLLSQ